MPPPYSGRGGSSPPSAGGDRLLEELEDLLRRGSSELVESAVVRAHDSRRGSRLMEGIRATESSLLHSKEAVLLAEVVDRGAAFGGQHPDSTAGCYRKYPPCWRRLVCPAHFSLLQLHILLQAAFDLPDSSSHNFLQYDTEGTGELRRIFEMVQASAREFLLLDTSDGAGVSFVQYSHPHQASQFARHIGTPGLFQASPTELYEERAFRVGDVLKGPPDEITYNYDYTSGRGAPHPMRVRILTEAVRPRPGSSTSAGTAMSGEPYPHCLAACGGLGGGAKACAGGGSKRANHRAGSIDDRRAVAQIERCVHDAFRDTFLEALKCSACRWKGARCSLAAGRCAGRCCSYCLHHPMVKMQGEVQLRQASMRAQELAGELQLHRREFLSHISSHTSRNQPGAIGPSYCPTCADLTAGAALAHAAMQ